WRERRAASGERRTRQPRARCRARQARTKGIDTRAASVRSFRSSSGTGPASSMARRRTLIIGDGAAGTTAAQYVRQADPNGLVTILSDDPNPAYFRAALRNSLLGELREE